MNPLIRTRMVACAMAFLASVACTRLQLTPPVSVENVRAIQSEFGIEVSFELIDEDGRTTALMSGDGVIRIEDAPADTELIIPGPLDSTRLLLNSRVHVDRTSFAHVSVPGRRGERTVQVCRFGTFPYARFLRAPAKRFGVVRVAIVPPDGSRVLQAARVVEWEPFVFEATVGHVPPFQ